MIIKISEYDNKYRIVSLAQKTESRKYFASNLLNYMYVDKDNLVIQPGNNLFKLSPNERDSFLDCSDFDVFEISVSGHAYRYYNCQSMDNAVLVTNRCNSNCIMCPTAENVRRKKEEYNAEELIDIAKHFPSDAVHVTITGGEPFIIKKDIFTLLKFLKESLPNTDYLLLTNGRAFCSKEYTDLLMETTPENLTLGIPLHGSTEEIHDRITQARGSFKQTFVGLKHLSAAGAKIELRIVISKLNLDNIYEIAELIASHFKNIFCVKFIGLEMTGNAAKNKDLVWIDYPTAFSKSKDAIDLLVKSGIDVGIYNFPLCAVDKNYWNICEKSISDYKVRFSPLCEKCNVKDACGGVFSGTIRLANEKIKPIGK